jgi:hypothetical protein
MDGVNCGQLEQAFLDARKKEQVLRDKWEKLDKIATKAMGKWLKQSKVRQQAYINYHENNCD